MIHSGQTHRRDAQQQSLFYTWKFFGSNHYSTLESFLVCDILKSGDRHSYVQTDGRTTCVKIVITTGRDFGSASWINWDGLFPFLLCTFFLDFLHLFCKAHRKLESVKLDQRWVEAEMKRYECKMGSGLPYRLSMLFKRHWSYAVKYMALVLWKVISWKFVAQ